MSMFTNYENIPSTYVPNNIQPKTIKHPVIKRPCEEYNLKGELVGFSWKYMDTIVLEFNTFGRVLYDEGVYEDAETYLEGKTFNLKFYNFRGEMIFEDTVPATIILKYYLSEELRKLLIPNTYSMSVTLIDEENDIRQTLLDSNVLKFFII